jgi:hypothetical protein
MELEFIYMCRPVDWTPYEKLFPDIEPSTIYPGSIIGKCSACDVDVYIGPKGQEVGARVCCFVCGTRIAAEENGPMPTPLMNLGNTFDRRK